MLFTSKILQVNNKFVVGNKKNIDLHPNSNEFYYYLCHTWLIHMPT